MSIETNSIDALEVARKNIQEYSVGIAQGRAYPSIKDGLKQSYRRAIYGMHINNKHKIVKVAELASFALPYHPHPTSVGPVIVSMGDNGNKLKLLETQGNFGDSSKGIEASAERYIGGYLSDFSEKLLTDSVEYCKMVKGEIDKDEPEALPALLPLCFINGLSGIPSGLPTLNIPTINVDDMISYYMDILKHKDLSYVPKKLPCPNVDAKIVSDEVSWETVLKTGKGSIRLAPVMSIDDEGTIKITALPPNKTFDSVNKIVEKEFLLEKIDVRDESTTDTCIVIEKVFRKQCDMHELYNRLYTKLQSSISYNMAFFDDNKIYVPCGFDSVVKTNIEYLIETHRNRLEHQINDLVSKLSVLEIIQSLKTSNQIKKLADMSYDEAVEYIAKKFSADRDIAVKVMQKPMSYLTKEHDIEIENLNEEIKSLESDNADIFDCLYKKYYELKKEWKSINRK